jgi:glutamine amidotransferase
MVAIVDYGVGNLFSLQSSFAAVGVEVMVTADPDILKNADSIILPGVGAFEDAANKLRQSGLDAIVKQKAAAGTPILGICLGMHMLFDKSFEFGEREGLSLIPGAVCPIAPVIGDLKTPQMGWNALILPKDKPKHPIFKYVNEGDHVYFVHSYAAMQCDASVSALTEYGALLTAAACRGNVCGTQFHPEKSGRVGLEILRAFTEFDPQSTKEV